MALNLILAIFWLLLAIASLLYFLFHPAGNRLLIFGKDVSLLWVTGIAVFMCIYRTVCWWLLRVRKRQRQAKGQPSARPDQRVEERNPALDFSEGVGKEGEDK